MAKATNVPYNNTIDLSKTLIRCPFAKCNTRLIKPKSNETFNVSVNGLDFLQAVKPSNISTKESSSDHVSSLEDEQSEPSNNPGSFIKVSDVWDFDNIGVSKEFPDDITISNGVNVERLIICSDCERGPLGFACFESSETGAAVKDVKDLQYYLCLSSVMVECTD
ncbi:hypothetical protein WICPIJ_001417 [Wickerhamomyces pijperi]|uniref:Mss4-like protein n=1 Tax=Wickerhamomyces pijperi TaxID=599730 RepID=A0A9P8QBN0_WICPI|nr:hypothetical protein WICPIJ_001417 [Wickerhamomyces pijperi]